MNITGYIIMCLGNRSLPGNQRPSRLLRANIANMLNLLRADIKQLGCDWKAGGK